MKPEVLADIHSLWEVFVDEGTDVVKICELEVIMKALNVIPRGDEINALIEKVDPNNEGIFTKDALVAIMEDKLKPTDTIEEMLEKFDLIDRTGSRKISAPELK